VDPLTGRGLSQPSRRFRESRPSHLLRKFLSRIVSRSGPRSATRSYRRTGRLHTLSIRLRRTVRRNSRNFGGWSGSCRCRQKRQYCCCRPDCKTVTSTPQRTGMSTRTSAVDGVKHMVRLHAATGRKNTQDRLPLAEGEVVGKPGRLVLVALQAAAAASGVDGNRTTRFAVRSPLPCGLRKVDSEVLEDGMLLNHLRVVIANGLLPLALLPLAACNNTKQPEKPSIKVLPRLMRRGTRPIVGKVWR
jgi:hypothetical protein